LAFFVLFGTMAAQACSCAGDANPCGFFSGPNGAAFIGTVTDVVSSNEKYGKTTKGGSRRITIKVDEIFKGNLPSVVETSDDGFSCDNFPFALGKSYLVYTKGVLENTTNIVPVGLCSGTQLVEKAAEAIDFLRQLRDGKQISILFGKVQAASEDANSQFKPLSDVKVVLTTIWTTDSNGKYSTPRKNEKGLITRTNDKGEYKFENLPRGRYRVNPVLPQGLWIPESREISTGGLPSCDSYPLTAYTNGSIAGKATTSEGDPVSTNLRISRVGNPFPYYGNETRSDLDGNFIFNGLSAGEYELSVYLHGYRIDSSKDSPFNSSYPYSHWFFPGTFNQKETVKIRLGHTEKRNDIRLQMPPFPKRRTITGTVMWEDGTVPASAMVTYTPKTGTSLSSRYAMTKEDGSFSLEIFDEFDYEFIAGNNHPTIRAYSERIFFKSGMIPNQLKMIIRAEPSQ
jgi:hypothetical protein